MVPGRLIFKGRVKVKAKFILEQTMVDQKGGRATASAVLLHFFFDAKVHVMPQHPVLLLKVKILYDLASGDISHSLRHYMHSG